MHTSRCRPRCCGCFCCVEQTHLNNVQKAQRHWPVASPPRGRGPAPPRTPAPPQTPPPPELLKAASAADALFDISEKVPEKDAARANRSPGTRGRDRRAHDDDRYRRQHCRRRHRSRGTRRNSGRHLSRSRGRRHNRGRSRGRSRNRSRDRSQSEIRRRPGSDRVADRERCDRHGHRSRSMRRDRGPAPKGSGKSCGGRGRSKGSGKGKKGFITGANCLAHSGSRSAADCHRRSTSRT